MTFAGFRKFLLISAALAVTAFAVLLYLDEREYHTMQRDPMVVTIVRDRVRWPCKLTLTKDTSLSLVRKNEPFGTVVVHRGVIVTAHGITDEGMLKVRWAELDVLVPMDNMDLIDLIFPGDGAMETPALPRPRRDL